MSDDRTDHELLVSDCQALVQRLKDRAAEQEKSRAAEQGQS